MPMMAVTLSQATPQQFKPERGSRFSGKSPFHGWLESLPLANMSAAGNELLAGLQELNHTKLSPRFRLACLEQLVEPVLAVVGALDKHFQDTSFPLTEKNDKIGRVAVQFFRELAMGYRLTADQNAANSAKVNLLHARTAALCVHRALSCSEQMLYRASLQYHEVPQQVWNEINVLYAFAFQNNIHHKTFKDSVGWLKQDFSIDDIYKRIAIIGISDAQRLSQRAIRQVYLASELWGRRCQMGTGDQAKASAGRFEINVDNDEPPRLIVEERTHDKPDFIIDISKMRDWLQDLLNQSDDPMHAVQFKVDGQKPLLIDAALLRQLVTTWGIRQSRSYQRLPAQHDIDLLLGINGIHFVVAGQMSFEEFLDHSRDNSFIQSPDATNNWVASSDYATRPNAHVATVLNQSLGGYCLRMSELEGVSLKVGELISLCPKAIAGRDAMWMIGVVRWLRAHGVDELELGVSVIGQSALAVALQVPEETASKLPPFRGLLIEPFGPNTSQPQSLLVPAFFARGSAEARICVRDGDEFSVREVSLLELVDRTSEYCRYRYRFDDQPDAVETMDDELDESGQASQMSA
jgi:hypothetical protein